MVKGVRQSFYALLGLLTVNVSMDDNNQFNFFFVALLVLAVIIVAGAILRCWFYRYQLMEDGIQ